MPTFAAFPADDIAVLVLVDKDVADDVVNRERSDFWNATVIGCAHIVTGPAIAVKRPGVPSMVVPSVLYSANTVVIPALLG